MSNLPEKAAPTEAKAEEALPPVEVAGAMKKALYPALKKISITEAERLRLVNTAATVAITFQGPLPPPEMAREYELLCPGFINRSLRMAENEQNAAIEDVRDTRQKNHNYRVLGMYLGAALLVLFLAASVSIAVYANAWAGGIMGIVTAGISVASLFINGRPLLDGNHAHAGSEDSQLPAPGKGSKRGKVNRRR